MIKICEKEPNKISGVSSLFLSFSYNPEIINVIKAYDKYVYDKKTYTWELPVNALSHGAPGSWTPDRTSIGDRISSLPAPSSGSSR